MESTSSCCVDHAGRRHTHWSTRCLRDVTLCQPITLLVADDALTFHSLSRDQRLACLWPQDRLNPTKPLCPPTYPPVQKAFERLFYSSATFILTQRGWTSFDVKAHNKFLMIQNIKFFFMMLLNLGFIFFKVTPNFNLMAEFDILQKHNLIFILGQ